MENVRASLRDVAFVGLIVLDASGQPGIVRSGWFLRLLSPSSLCISRSCCIRVALFQEALPDASEWKAIGRLHLVTALFVCLAGFRATVTLDAVVKAVIRTATGKKLLEWRSTSEIGHQAMATSALFRVHHLHVGSDTPHPMLWRSGLCELCGPWSSSPAYG